MSLSKKNNDKLKSYLNNYNDNKDSPSNIHNDLFYSIIDNEIDIKERNDLIEFLTKNKSTSLIPDVSTKEPERISKNNNLSEEDLLYDEFNIYLINKQLLCFYFHDSNK